MPILLLDLCSVQVVSKDSNVMLVGIAVKCIGLLATGLRKKFNPHAVGVRSYFVLNCDVADCMLYLCLTVGELASNSDLFEDSFILFSLVSFHLCSRIMS
jgi:hypothetical protein